MKIIFLVDDSCIIEIVAESIRKEGYKVEIARTIDEAKAKIRSKNFDLIITDLRLSYISRAENGLELAKFSKKFQPSTPILLMSCEGKIESEFVDFSIELGGGDDLVIPTVKKILGG